MVSTISTGNVDHTIVQVCEGIEDVGCDAVPSTEVGGYSWSRICVCKELTDIPVEVTVVCSIEMTAR